MGERRAITAEKGLSETNAKNIARASMFGGTFPETPSFKRRTNESWLIAEEEIGINHNFKLKPKIQEGQAGNISALFALNCLNEFSQSTSLGCSLDLIVLMDASGSVRTAFEREKKLVVKLLSQLNIGPNDTRVALIKFSTQGKVRTLHSLGSLPQNVEKVTGLVRDAIFSDGTTAIHSALLHVRICQ